MPPGPCIGLCALSKPTHHLPRVSPERKHCRGCGGNSHFAPYFAAMVRSKTNVHIRVWSDPIYYPTRSISIHLLVRSWCLVAIPWTWHMEIQPVRSLAASSCKRRKARAIRSVRPSGLFQTEELVLGDRAAQLIKSQG